ncbi:hypothetical protein ED733_003071 [Metarhizium rileyi]|uniref:GED domain-containing protein n=1 Tax=Metarhizium rileyi (strain RCEF 4871) TaxID=1649241 RepID=A0A5C6G6F4_METRR|nr:hypothetical protein ED733_003071 [Metarhizium rileyi]
MGMRRPSFEPQVNYVAVDETASGIFSRISIVGDKFRSDLDSEIKKLLEPHLNRHPITYNHYLTDNVQKAQDERRRKKLSDAFEEIVGPDYYKKGIRMELYPHDLFNKLRWHTKGDMQLHASELATDYMEAYYKVACKNLIDAVSVLAVEQCLVGKLPSLFQAELILDLEDDEITHLAQESDGAAIKRVQCNDKLAVLEAGKEDLNRLDSHRSLSLGNLPLSSRLERSQADDKLVHPVSNEPNGENNTIINSLNIDLPAMESASAATQSDTESLKRADVDSLDELRSRQKRVENGYNLWNGSSEPVPEAEPYVDLSWGGLTLNKDKKKKKSSSLWPDA